MGLQLTTLLHRLAGGRQHLHDGGPDGAHDAGEHAGQHVAARPAAGADLRDATAARVRGLLPDAERVRLDALVDGSPDAVVLGRVLGATSSVDAVAEVAAHLADADAGVRRAVRDPVRAMARAGRQSDGTTCGSSVLAMVAALGDPTLALWLATGAVVGAARPPELSGASDAALRALADAPREARFAAVQRVLRRRTSARAVLGLSWPPQLGTPPWTAARTARFLGMPYGHAPLDDTDREHLDRTLDVVGRAVALGVPVPLYTGGDTSRGWSTALPRHVVLAVPEGTAGVARAVVHRGDPRVGGPRVRGDEPGERDPGAQPDALPAPLHVWEPGAGRVVVADRTELTAGRPHAALGQWSHLAWVLTPRLPGLTAGR